MPSGSDAPQVPVTMGSSDARTLDAGSVRATHAFFPEDTHLEAHTHDRPTFAVMLEGGFDLAFTSPAVRCRELDCSSGTIFTEPAGETHGNVIHGGGARVVVLQPDLEDERFEPVRRMLSDRINHFRHGRIAANARRVAREIARPDTLSVVALEALALEMMVEASRVERRPTASDAVSAWFRRAEDYVHASFRAAPRIADVAEVAGVHPAHLATVFREVYDVPLGTYLRKLRVEWVADRLAGGDEPIADLAFRAGFADQAHLTRTFKRMTGWTPAAYRRSRRGRSRGSPRPQGDDPFRRSSSQRPERNS